MGERGITMSDADIKMDFYYCPRCLEFDTQQDECVMCRVLFNLCSPEDYIGEVTIKEMNDFLEDPARKEDPRFDQEAFERRVNYVPMQYEDILARAFGGSAAIVSCPYCHSKKTKKISSGSKLLNTALFGAFGNKRRYQWHCNSCGSDF